MGAENLGEKEEINFLDDLKSLDSEYMSSRKQAQNGLQFQQKCIGEVNSGTKNEC